MHSFPWIGAALALGVVACSGGAADTADTSAGALSGDHVDAQNCQLFVDKASVAHSSHGLFLYRVWLKTLNDRLDGPPVKAGFHATIHESGACSSQHFPPSSGCSEVGQWTDMMAERFAGAPDYFSLEFELASDFSFARSYEGVFFVETDKGTRYWFKAADQKNLVLDIRGAEDIEAALDRNNTPWWDRDVGGLPKTADFFSYLNPAKCR